MPLEAVVALAASAVTVGAGVVAVVRWLRRRPADATVPGKQMLLERAKPLDFEFVPIRFEVDTSATIPRVVVTLRAVNHNRKPLMLTTVRIRFLQTGERGLLEEIDSPDEYEVPARQSREVYGRRNLVEAEAALFRALPHHTWLQGGCMIGGVGKVGRREVRYEPGATFVIFGTAI